jgi:CrcB protein
MGLLAGWLALRAGAEGERVRLLLGVGVLGGFTTFSAFSLETLMMIERRAWAQAGLYALLSVLLSTAAVFLGLLIMRRWAA